MTKTKTKCYTRWRWCIVALALFAISGCTTYRAIPQHGGGKRFDEEQRVVAASIAHAVKQLDFTEYKGKKAQLFVQEMETSGNGRLVPAGVYEYEIESFARTGDVDLYRNEFDYSSSDYEKSRNTYENLELYSEFTYITSPTLRSYRTSTTKDIDYLKEALGLKIKLDGVKLVEFNPDVVLFIMVNVLGTNYSTQNSFFYVKEMLRSSCELTYYPYNPKTGEVIGAAKQVNGGVIYNEGKVSFTNMNSVSYGIDTNKVVAYELPQFMKAQEYRAQPVASRSTITFEKKRTALDIYREAMEFISVDEDAAAEKLLVELKRSYPDSQFIDELEAQLNEEEE